MLHTHHDLSFHLGSEVETNGSKTEHASGTYVAEHDPHHHHEIHLVIDELPVFRANELPKTEVSAPTTIASVQPDSSQFPKTPSKGTVLTRAPPEVLQSHLEIIRTQVLRL